MDKVYQFLSTELHFKAKDKIVVGVSGGPDSMVLLSLLLNLKVERDIELICAHINHGLRKESIDEKKFVEQYCKNNDITFEYLELTEYSADNFHNQARHKRYDFFNKLINKYKAQYLMTAHHGDDLMETILMRIVRGSTLQGYSGFKKITKMDNYSLIRPLISVTKDEIIKYAKENHIEYKEDLSNLKDTYTRNRYRKNILPFLKLEDPNVNDKFLKFSETLTSYSEYVKAQVLKEFNQVYQNNQLDLLKFNTLDNLIKKETINYLFEIIYGDDLNLIADIHTESVLNMIVSSKPNAKVYLPNQYQAIKSYNLLELKKETTIGEYQLELETINILPNGKIIEIVEESLTDDNNICRLNKTDLKLPLFIRNKQEGDKIEIKGTNGTKKIKDLFIDEKISTEERNSWPILVDSHNNILWIPGLKKSKFNQPKTQKCDIILKYY